MWRCVIARYTRKLKPPQLAFERPAENDGIFVVSGSGSQAEHVNLEMAASPGTGLLFKASRARLFSARMSEVCASSLEWSESAWPTPVTDSQHRLCTASVGKSVGHTLTRCARLLTHITRPLGLSFLRSHRITSHHEAVRPLFKMRRTVQNSPLSSRWPPA